MGAAGRASPLGDGAAVKGVDGRAERLRKVTSTFKGTGEGERDNSEEGSHLFHSVVIWDEHLLSHISPVLFVLFGV